MSKNAYQMIPVGRYRIGAGQPPFIIAEMSGNHNRSLKRALAIVRAAAKAGANAVKLQTYTADTMTLDVRKRGFVIRDRKSLWKGLSLYELYRDASTPWEWHAPIFNLCRKLGLIGFSTPFDETAVNFLETLKVPLYKISSFELVDLPLIRRVARTGKPILMSTGMATLKEIHEAVHTARTNGSGPIALLKCTSTYPAQASECNLRTIAEMARRFRCQVGLSDHTMGIGVSLASVALGASLIERHFTLARADGGVDSAFSLEPQELLQLVNGARAAWESLGKIRFGPSAGEKPSLLHRRSVYVCQNMKAGDIFSKENVRAIRPGLGLPPKHMDMILGRRIKRDAVRGTPLSLDLIEGQN